MAPVKNTAIAGRHGGRFVRTITGRVYKTSHNRLLKTKKAMKKPQWQSSLEESDLDIKSSGDGHIADHVKLHDSGASQSALNQTPVIKTRSEDDNISLHDIPEWPGSDRPTKIKRSQAADHREIGIKMSSVNNGEISLWDIPEWHGSSESIKVKGNTNNNGEISLWDIPQCPINLHGNEDFAAMPSIAREGERLNIGTPGSGSSEYPGVGHLDYQSHIPRSDNYYDDDSYYRSLLLRKQQCLLEMQIWLKRQEIINAGPESFDFQAFMQE